MRKIWSSDNFKVNVAPHDFVNAIEIASEHRFRVGHRSTVTEFMPWLLGRLCRSIPLVRKLFSGKVKIRSEELVVKNNDDNVENVGSSSKTKVVPFIQLTLDLPDMPLFKDGEGTLCVLDSTHLITNTNRTQTRTGGNIIPQEPLPNVLRKFDGTTPTDMLVQRKRNFYKLERLPKFLVLCLKRFKKNNFTVEKNSTIVNFPLRSLDMRNYVDDAKLKMPYLPNDAELQAMSVKRLRKVLSRAKIKHEDVVERKELIRRAKGVIREIRNKYVTKYDLVSNIVHDIGTTEEIVEGADPIQVGYLSRECTPSKVVISGMILKICT